MTQAELQIRRDSQREIEAVCRSTESDAEKLRKCMAISDAYCAITGDDSLTPPPLLKAREEQCKTLDKTMKAIKSIQADKAKGTRSLFE